MSDDIETEDAGVSCHTGSDPHEAVRPDDAIIARLGDVLASYLRRDGGSQVPELEAYMADPRSGTALRRLAEADFANDKTKTNPMAKTGASATSKANGDGKAMPGAEYKVAAKAEMKAEGKAAGKAELGGGGYGGAGRESDGGSSRCGKEETELKLHAAQAAFEKAIHVAMTRWSRPGGPLPTLTLENAQTEAFVDQVAQGFLFISADAKLAVPLAPPSKEELSEAVQECAEAWIRVAGPITSARLAAEAVRTNEIGGIRAAMAEVLNQVAVAVEDILDKVKSHAAQKDLVEACVPIIQEALKAQFAEFLTSVGAGGKLAEPLDEEQKALVCQALEAKITPIMRDLQLTERLMLSEMQAVNKRLLGIERQWKR